MWTKATIGALAAVVVVAGGAGAAIAHAQTTAAPAASATPTGTATTGGTATATKGKGAAKGQGRADSVAKEILGKVADFQHAEWVTKGDSNSYVTHEAIQGQVTAVSASSITVKSADGTSMTFAVNATTKVHDAKAAKAAKAAKGKGTKGATGTATTGTAAPTTAPMTSPTTSTATPSISDLKTGQTVIVGGTKSPDLTAQQILARAS